MNLRGGTSCVSFAAREYLRAAFFLNVRVLFAWTKRFDVLLGNRLSAIDGAGVMRFPGPKGERRVVDTEIGIKYDGSEGWRTQS